MLFKEFGGVATFPICLATKDVSTIVETVKLIALFNKSVAPAGAAGVARRRPRRDLAGLL